MTTRYSLRLGAILALALSTLAGCANSPSSNMPSINWMNQQHPNSRAARELANQGVEPQIDLSEVARINAELAANYYNYKQYDAAFDAIERALAAQPNNPKVLILSGFIQVELKNDLRAQTQFDQALSLAPMDSDIIHNYATYLCRTGREGASIAVFDRALAISNNRRPSLSQTGAGMCLLKEKKVAEAFNRFQDALASDPGNPQALMGAADANLQMGNFVRSKDLLHRLRQVAAPSAESLWIEIQVARATHTRSDEVMLSADLRGQFPNSEQIKLLNSSL